MSFALTRFMGDLAEAYAWATPAPIGYVEPGWVAIVVDLLRSVDRLLSTLPGATLDILDVRERDGVLELAYVLDGGDVQAAARVGEIVATARSTSALTCWRCGVPRCE